MIALSALSEPVGQVVQVVAALTDENEPGSQIAHAVAGLESVSAVPGSHAVQDACSTEVAPTMP